MSAVLVALFNDYEAAERARVELVSDGFPTERRADGRLRAAAACCAFAIASISACAAEQIYNPDNLSSEQFARVPNICQNVMGLSPKEALSGGYWMGKDRLDYWTSKYRGCIVSLSDSLQSAMDEQVIQQADAGCRGKGFETGSPDLALCVLRSVTGRPGSPPAQTPTATPVSETLPRASGSSTYASPHETGRREQVACAALGFEPAHAAFKSCVKGLSDTFYAIDHPID